MSEALTRSRIDHWLRNRHLMFYTVGGNGIGFGPTGDAIMALLEMLAEYEAEASRVAASRPLQEAPSEYDRMKAQKDAILEEERFATVRDWIGVIGDDSIVDLVERLGFEGGTTSEEIATVREWLKERAEVGPAEWLGARALVQEQEAPDAHRRCETCGKYEGMDRDAYCPGHGKQSEANGPQSWTAIPPADSLAWRVWELEYEEKSLRADVPGLWKQIAALQEELARSGGERGAAPDPQWTRCPNCEHLHTVGDLGPLSQFVVGGAASRPDVAPPETP